MEGIQKEKSKVDLKERILENWALTYKSKQRIFTAKTENDLKHIIKFAHKNKLQISIKGSGQSYNEQSFVKNGVTIDMIAMNRINTIDINNKWLIVQSGCLISEALKIIILKGFTIGAIPGSDKVSFGGAFINFVHGKDSKTFGSFINNIIEIKVILTNGKIKVSGAAYYITRGDFFQSAMATMAQNDTSVIDIGGTKLKVLNSSRKRLLSPMGVIF